MKRMILFTAALAVALFVGASAQACHKGSGGAPKGGGSGTFNGSAFQGGLGGALDKLGLTDDQKTAIKAAAEKVKTAFQSGDREAGKAAAAAFRQQLDTILTADQKAKLAEFKAQFQNRRNHGGGGGAPPAAN